MRILLEEGETLTVTASDKDSEMVITNHPIRGIERYVKASDACTCNHECPPLGSGEECVHAPACNLYRTRDGYRDLDDDE